MVALEAVRSARHLRHCPSPAPRPPHPLLAVDLAWHRREADLLHLVLLVVVQVGGKSRLVGELSVTINTATFTASQLRGELLSCRLPQPGPGRRLTLASPCSASQTLLLLLGGTSPLVPLLRRTSPSSFLLRGTSPSSPLGRRWTCLPLSTILTLRTPLPSSHYTGSSTTTLFHIGEELCQPRPISSLLSRVFLFVAGEARLRLHHGSQLVSQGPSQDPSQPSSQSPHTASTLINPVINQSQALSGAGGFCHNQWVTDCDKVTGSKAATKKPAFVQERKSSSTATELEPIAPKIAKLLLSGACCCCSPLHGLLATAAAARSRAADPSQQKQQRRSSNPRDSSRVPLGVGCP